MSTTQTPSHERERGDEESRRAAEAPAPPGEEQLGVLRPRFTAERSPAALVWTYAASLVLTVAALWLAVNRLLAPVATLAVLLGLAATQGGLQIGVFMHLREGRGPAWQVVAIGLALFTGLGLVGMSIWIMAFKSGVS